MAEDKKDMKVISVDLNGKPIDWETVKLPDDLARKCLEIANREERPNDD